MELDKVKQGKRNRANGASFELRTRKDLQEQGWIVDKWSNNVELPISTEESEEKHGYANYYPGKIIPAKRKYNAFSKVMAIGTGFPDFIAFRNISYGDEDNGKSSMYEAIGVECKTNGTLDKIEKEKCRWYLDNRIFGKILIASKTKVKNKIVIKYENFEERYG
jgi:hypothetical protein